MEIFTIFPSWLLTTALVLFMFCMFLYTLRSNKSSITTPKLPPNPPKLPIIGNLHKLIGKPRHEALWQLSKEYGPVMLFYIGSKPYLIISSPAMQTSLENTRSYILFPSIVQRREAANLQLLGHRILPSKRSPKGDAQDFGV
ncbi:putative cytochrome P450 [Helianthus annuus]|nr:putative cytochrome P450 [Helianthus annuus]KAJ0729075.1 putative cytochrome P450 [Helianthus annuus]